MLHVESVQACQTASYVLALASAQLGNLTVMALPLHVDAIVVSSRLFRSIRLLCEVLPVFRFSHRACTGVVEAISPSCSQLVCHQSVNWCSSLGC